MMYSTISLHAAEIAIQKLREGDCRAMATIFAMHKDYFIGYAYNIIANESQAQDIVTEAFIKVWRKRDFKNRQNLRSFLFVAIKNACLTYLQLKKGRARVHSRILFQAKEAEQSFESRLIRSEAFRFILREAENLPAARKKIFKLTYLDGLSSMEIADMLNLSINTVRVQKARALQDLRTQVLMKGMSNPFCEYD